MNLTNLTEEFLRLERNPLWASGWVKHVDSLRAFHAQWGAAAEAAGWSLVELYGLDLNAPHARLSRWGGAFLACLPERSVTEIDSKAIRFVTTRGVRLSAYWPEAAGVLAWEIPPPKNR
jgi:hypothetical protein